MIRAILCEHRGLHGFHELSIAKLLQLKSGIYEVNPTPTLRVTQHVFNMDVKSSTFSVVLTTAFSATIKIPEIKVENGHLMAGTPILGNKATCLTPEHDSSPQLRSMFARKVARLE